MQKELLLAYPANSKEEPLLLQVIVGRARMQCDIGNHQRHSESTRRLKCDQKMIKSENMYKYVTILNCNCTGMTGSAEWEDIFVGPACHLKIMSFIPFGVFLP